MDFLPFFVVVLQFLNCHNAVQKLNALQSKIKKM